MGSLKLLIYGLLSQKAAVLALMSSHPDHIQLLLFATAHLIASLLFSALLTAFFPRAMDSKRSAVFVFFFIFSFMVPLLGAASMMAALVYFRWFHDREARAEFSSVDLPPFMTEGSALAAGMGEGGAWTRLRTAELPRAQRLKALLAVGSAGGQNASSFLRHATGDSDDEIRLLAFNLAERQEQRISRAITTALEALKTAKSPMESSNYCRSLAFSYWEMVYNANAKDELTIFYVNQALEYANRALTEGCDDPLVNLLLGRILMIKGELRLAEEHVSEALSQGVSPSRALPYQAELAYLKRDFEGVRACLSADKSLRYKPGIGPVVQYWGV